VNNNTSDTNTPPTDVRVAVAMLTHSLLDSDTGITGEQYGALMCLIKLVLSDMTCYRISRLVDATDSSFYVHTGSLDWLASTPPEDL